jgi:hypothetical protein
LFILQLHGLHLVLLLLALRLRLNGLLLRGGSLQLRRALELS